MSILPVPGRAIEFLGQPKLYLVALLEPRQVSRRGRVQTPDHIERAVSLYASGRSCASIGKELQVTHNCVTRIFVLASLELLTRGNK
jgi:hypothetical protein